jgi:hypothetical protein
MYKFSAVDLGSFIWFFPFIFIPTATLVAFIFHAQYVFKPCQSFFSCDSSPNSFLLFPYLETKILINMYEKHFRGKQYCMI